MKKVFFMHIPKTGGGTFEASIAPHMINPAPRMSYEDALNFDFGDYDWIAGHYPIGLAAKLPEDTIKVTLLRDPVMRVLSHYAYLHENGLWTEPEYSEFCKGASLEEWLDSLRGQQDAYNHMTSFFTDENKTIFTDEEIGAWLESFDVIGFVNEANGLQNAANSLFQLLDRQPPVVQGTYNASSFGTLLSTLQPSTLDTLQRYNQVDLNLYIAAQLIRAERWREEQRP